VSAPAPPFAATPPAFAIPRGACDCHLHVFGPRARYPFAARRAYTPSDAPPAAAAAMLRRLGFERAVLVQPSVYGSDNRCLLDGVAVLGPCSRAIAQIDPDAGESELDRLGEAGVRGVRLNALARGMRDPAVLTGAIAALAGRIEGRGWHLQLHLPARALEMLESVLAALPVAVVIDHFGQIPAAPDEAAAADALCRLLAQGHVWLKLSGADRFAAAPAEDAFLGALVARLVATAPARLVFGSDWPHTPIHQGAPRAEPPCHPFRPVDTGGLLAALAAWVPDAGLRHRILVDNPGALYGFT
jgi:predicted TIM-barrel fold metal-dependent hydrolase